MGYSFTGNPIDYQPPAPKQQAPAPQANKGPTDFWGRIQTTGIGKVNLLNAAHATKKAGGATGRFLFGGTAKLANQGIQEGKQAVETGRGEMAKRTGNQNALQASIQRQNQDYKGFKKSGGILNQGTITSEEEAKKGDAKTGIKKIGGGTLQAAAEVLPVKGLSGAKKVFQEGKGLVEGAEKVVPKIVKNTAAGAGIGAAGNTGAQLAEKGKINLKETAKSAGAGAIIGGGAAALGEAFKDGAKAIMAKVHARNPEGPMPNVLTDEKASKLIPKKIDVQDQSGKAQNLTKMSEQDFTKEFNKLSRSYDVATKGLKDKAPGQQKLLSRVIDTKHEKALNGLIDEYERGYRVVEKPTSAALKVDKTPTVSVSQEVSPSKTAALVEGRGTSAGVAKDINVPNKLTATDKGEYDRVHQYDAHLQDAVKGAEESSTYKGALKTSGGDQVVGNKEVYEKAKTLGPMSDQEIMNAKVGDKVDAVHVVRAKATMNQAAEEFTSMYKSGAGEGDLNKAAERLAKMEAGYKTISAEPGRATQIQSSFIDDGYKLQQKLADLQRTVKGPNKKAVIDKELGKYEKELQKSGISQSTAKKLSGMFAEYATSAKLTSPLTHVINISSNLLTIPQRAAENIVKTGYKVAAGKTGIGQAKYAFGTTHGFAQATKNLAENLGKIVKGKGDEIKNMSEKAETEPAIKGGVGTFIRTPFHALSAADSFFKTFLRDGELHQRAYQQGWQEGFRGAGLKSRVAELVKSPSEEMETAAKKTAAEYTFNADPGVVVKHLSQALNDVPILRLLIPFVRTPTNIVKFQAQRSPIGIFTPTNIKALMKDGEGRAEAVAKLTVGAGMSVGGLMAAFNAGDNITGAAPTNPGEREAFYNEGKKPYSVKIGNKWVAYNRFQPVGMYLTQAVGLRDALTKGDSKTAGNVFTSLVATTAKGMADLPFVSGVSNVIGALNDPSDTSTVNKAFSGIISGTIPNISRDFATASDDKQRNPKTITQQVQQSIPGQRQKTPVRINSFGKPQANAGTPFERGFVKIVSPEQGTKLTKELDNSGYKPAPPARTQRGKLLNAAQYQKFQEDSGQKFATRLQRAMKDPNYSNADQEEKQRILGAAMSDSRAEALDSLFGTPGRKQRSQRLLHYR